jgi:hypothetical protein
MGGVILMGVVAYFSVVRNQFTEDDHDKVCGAKQALVHLELKHINTKLVEHDNEFKSMGKKLDRLIANGKETI